MRILLVALLLTTTSCETINSFNNWADSIMPTHDDFHGSKVVYSPSGERTGGNYQQGENYNPNRVQQPIPTSQQPTQTYEQYQQQGYVPPVNGLPPVQQQGEYKSRFDQGDDYGNDRWSDPMIPDPPGGYR